MAIRYEGGEKIKKIVLIWGVAGVASVLLWLLRHMGVIDGMDGIFFGLGIIGYMFGISAATWALHENKKATTPM